MPVTMSVPLIRYLPSNTAGRDFLVGDLHGCYQLLQDSLEGVSFDPTVDRVISVGDLIDRGPDSVACIGLLDESWFFAVRGNHEQLMIDALLHDDEDAMGTWLYNGGVWIVQVNEDKRTELARRLDELSYAIVVGKGEKRFNVLHAEFYGSDQDLDRVASIGMTRRQSAVIIEGRKICKDRFRPGAANAGALSATYCGHTIVDVPFSRSSHVFIDTGAYHPRGRLTLLEHGNGPVLEMTTTIQPVQQQTNLSM